MNITQIESNLQKLIKSFSEKTFIYDLLLCYGLPKASITRLQKGNLNLSKNDGEIVWKKKLYFNAVKDAELHETIDNLRNDSKVLKHSPRFIVVTDYDTILAVDTKTQDTLDTEIEDLPEYYDFFLPWAGMEKAQYKDENPADIKAAERMAKLFDEIRKDNPDESPEFIHSLNVFLSRLLFCFFAEDTNIFEENQLTQSISSHTQEDGSDLNTYLDKLFEVLNTEKNKRKDIPAYLQAFPYVNGGLFRDKYNAPVFTKRSRKVIIDSGQLNWSAINPDIFGSMMQAVVTPEHRGGLGMHYTSVPNIMKVIEPLFLNELYEEFEKAKGNDKKLDQLLGRLQKIKIFDPACGSGNFLIIAYKELRKLEIKILKARKEFATSGISLNQFYGIEIDDFAHEIATLSLWLAEHQMNLEFFREFGRTKPTLPLKETGHIVCGNATRLNWDEVCPKNEDDEIYILGNPPYLGARLLDKNQKSDMALVFHGNIPRYNDLDYITCWFYKGFKFIEDSNIQFAFVSTNSISQGSQVAIFWPYILSDKIEIKFAYQPFKWINNAKHNAGVTCVIIGLRNSAVQPRYIYNGHLKHHVSNISPYLIAGKNCFISGRNIPLSKLPEITFGSMPNDNGYLILSEDEYTLILSSNPEISQFIRVMYGGEDFIKGHKRFCFWINEKNHKQAIKNDLIKKRIQKVKEYRLASPREATKKLASLPYRFGEVRHKETELIVIPATSSEQRFYIPMGFLPKGTVVNNSTQAIYDAEYWIFGIITSAMHMIWVRSVAGRLESRIRYSALLCYNTFPFPNISADKKEEISKCVYRILEEREKHPEKTLAQLYDPDKMPDGLREAHRLNDLAVERCYRSKPFESDEERLEYLFKLYEQMITEEQAQKTLFAEQKKKRKKGK